MAPSELKVRTKECCGCNWDCVVLKEGVLRGGGLVVAFGAVWDPAMGMHRCTGGASLGPNRAMAHPGFRRKNK
jgi:hypothetical protein